MFLKEVKLVRFLSVLESESGVGVVFAFGGSIFYKLGLHCFGILNNAAANKLYILMKKSGDILNFEKLNFSALV